MSKADSSDQSRHFSTDHLRSDLKGRSVRAGAVAISTQISRFVINIGGIAILARILAPSDFGLIAMLYAATNFVDMFRDMGLSAATIQRKEITHDQVSTLFWLNVLFSAAVATIIVVGAPLIAAWYEVPALTNVARVIGATFFLGGLNAQHTALLTRQMRFLPQSIITLSSMLLGTIAAVVAAKMGMAYWSLVVQQVVLACVSTICIWSVSGWMPGLPKWNCGAWPMVRYGSNMAAFSFVNMIARSSDSFLIGKMFGAASAGLYSQAYRLVLMPIQQINAPLTNVAMPALSRLQSEPERYRRFYINAVGVTTLLGMPIVAMLFVAAEPTIRLMLGPKWMDCVPLFRLLAPAAFFGTFNVATSWVYGSLGHTHRQLRWGVITSSLTVAGFIVGLKYGPAGVATAFSIIYCGVTMGVPGLWYCFRGTPLRLRDAWKAMWRPAAASIAAAIVTFEFVHHVGMPDSAAVSLLLQASVFAGLYTMAWLALPDGRQHLSNVFSLMKSLKQKPGVPQSVEVATPATSNAVVGVPPAPVAAVGASA